MSRSATRAATIWAGPWVSLRTPSNRWWISGRTPRSRASSELTLEGLQLMSTNLRASRLRMATLRAINSRLSGMRRRLGPQRGIFERISEEIGRVEGLDADSEQYFERIYAQLNRLIDAIDAA